MENSTYLADLRLSEIDSRFRSLVRASRRRELTEEELDCLCEYAVAFERALRTPHQVSPSGTTGQGATAEFLDEIDAFHFRMVGLSHALEETPLLPYVPYRASPSSTSLFGGLRKLGGWLRVFVFGTRFYFSLISGQHSPEGSAVDRKDRSS